MPSMEIADLQRSKVARWTAIMAGLVLALFVTIVVCLSVGVMGIPFDQVIAILLGGGTKTQSYVIMNVRLPRVILAAMVGASLSIAGATMQGLFRNPMASPSVLGISSGAAFGAALAIVLGVSWTNGPFAIPAMAFVFSFITLFLVYTVSRNRSGYVPVETLLLAGIAVGSLFSALVSAMEYFAGEQLSGVVFWMMGGLDEASWEQVAISIVPLIVGCSVIMVLARDLNAMIISGPS